VRVSSTEPASRKRRGGQVVDWLPPNLLYKLDCGFRSHLVTCYHE